MRNLFRILPDIDARSGRGEFDVAIAMLATRQHGVVARTQLLAIGLSRQQIATRITAGRLHQLHLGVYAVGHRRLPRAAERIAAVLAGGESAVLSHISAAELWEIRKTSSKEIHVTAPVTKKRPGIHFHRAALDPTEMRMRDGIPVTSPNRTLIDIARGANVEGLEHAIRDATYRGLTSHSSLARAFAECERRPGGRTLRSALDLAASTDGITRSKLERRFLVLLRTHKLPLPKLNHRIELSTRAIEADCAWPGSKLVVELDGYRAHGDRRAFESDRSRDRDLLVAGWRVIRITWRQITTAADALVTQLQFLLAAD